MHSDTNNGHMMSKFQIIFRQSYSPKPKRYSYKKCLKTLVKKSIDECVVVLVTPGQSNYLIKAREAL